MKQNLMIILSVVLLAVAITAERMSVRQLNKTVARGTALKKQRSELQARTRLGQVEKAKYAKIQEAAQRIQERVEWDAESTRMLRWFAEQAARAGARVVNSKVLPDERDGGTAAHGAYRRLRVDLRMDGGYRALVQCVEQMERSNHPMVIETLTITADRQDYGRGELKITVSCLTPVPRPKAAH